MICEEPGGSRRASKPARLRSRASGRLSAPIPLARVRSITAPTASVHSRATSLVLRSWSASSSASVTTAVRESARSDRASSSSTTLSAGEIPSSSAKSDTSREATAFTVPIRAPPSRRARSRRPASIKRPWARRASSAAARFVNVVAKIASGRADPETTASSRRATSRCVLPLPALAVMSSTLPMLRHPRPTGRHGRRARRRHNSSTAEQRRAQHP